jgi:hypothetical protein
MKEKDRTKRRKRLKRKKEKKKKEQRERTIGRGRERREWERERETGEQHKRAVQSDSQWRQRGRALETAETTVCLGAAEQEVSSDLYCPIDRHFLISIPRFSSSWSSWVLRAVRSFLSGASQLPRSPVDAYYVLIASADPSLESERVHTYVVQVINVLQSISRYGVPGASQWPSFVIPLKSRDLQPTAASLGRCPVAVWRTSRNAGYCLDIPAALFGICIASPRAPSLRSISSTRA